MKVAIIPARGGSKRIPRKNAKTFCGQPMIAWPIQAAIDSACFDRIIVSTDDDEIAELARHYGSEVPFVRPADLAGDHIGTTPVVAHAIGWLGQNGAMPEFACCIYATAPFLRAADLRSGLEMLIRSGCDYVFSVTSFEFPIQRALRITSQGRLAMFHPEHEATRSQDLEPAYHDAGQFYWGTAAAWCQQRKVFGPDSIPLVLPRYRVQDIDTLEDWTRAESMFCAISSSESLQEMDRS